MSDAAPDAPHRDAALTLAAIAKTSYFGSGPSLTPAEAHQLGDAYEREVAELARCQELVVKWRSAKREVQAIDQAIKRQAEARAGWRLDLEYHAALRRRDDAEIAPRAQRDAVARHRAPDERWEVSDLDPRAVAVLVALRKGARPMSQLADALGEPFGSLLDDLVAGMVRDRLVSLTRPSGGPEHVHLAADGVAWLQRNGLDPGDGGGR